MNFYILRLSFNKLQQRHVNKKEFHGTRMELIEELLQAKYVYKREKIRGYVDFHLGNFKIIENSDDKDIFFATLGKYKEVKKDKYNENEKEHYREKETLSPWVAFLIDPTEQVFIIQKNTSAFPNYNSLFNSIEEHLNRLLYDYELSVSIAPISLPNDFWVQVSEYNRIYVAKFELFMPNHFGHTNESVKDMLLDTKEEVNADEVVEQVSNKEGKLKLSKDNKRINKLLDWIGKGGGKWLLRCSKGDDSDKNTITSTKEAQAFGTSKDIDTETIEEEKNFKDIVNSVIRDLKRHYATHQTTKDKKE
ncbi:hypothetical protein Mpsy_0287 [Methanolobus psychrophilus R15]|nr:hypothetical protein Mpsy_0287 [Methanolobus psychrophilus R15]